MSQRITVTLHEVVAALDTYADAYLKAHHAVSFNLFEFLAALVEQAPIDITDLAHCLRISKAAVSKRVPGLVSAGWVQATPGEGRRVVLTPTAATIDLVRAAGGELEAEFAAIFDEGAHAGHAVTTAALNARLNHLVQRLQEKELP